MFDMPGLDMISPFIGGKGVDPSFSPMDSIADAAGDAWDWGSNAVQNIGGAFDPSMIGGPFMPSGGGSGKSGGSPGTATATGEIEPELYFGLPDLADLGGGSGASGTVDIQPRTPYEDDLVY